MHELHTTSHAMKGNIMLCQSGTLLRYDVTFVIAYHRRSADADAVWNVCQPDCV